MHVMLQHKLLVPVQPMHPNFGFMTYMYTMINTVQTTHMYINNNVNNNTICKLALFYKMMSLEIAKVHFEFDGGWLRGSPASVSVTSRSSCWGGATLAGPDCILQLLP